MKRIRSRAFFLEAASVVAPSLLGKVLVTKIKGEITKGLITEVEAYEGSHDEAAHSFRGKTKRNEVMFQRGGHVYVYFIYGVHYCVNVVTGAEGDGSAVLIRAVAPLAGEETMAARRGNVPTRSLANGPGKVTRAFSIGPELNGEDLLTSHAIWLEECDPPHAGTVIQSTRIGISKAASLPWNWKLQIARGGL